MFGASTLKYGRSEEVGMDPARIDLIRARARSWVANGDTPSLVLLVARKGVIVLEEAFGILRASDSSPLQTDSIFGIQSISKSFTAAAVLCLVEDGLLSLKHPITDYVPEITTPGAEQVLIADLLTHCSGYDDAVVYRRVGERLKENLPIPEAAHGQHPLTNWLIRYAADAPFTRPPGEAMSYCNFGFDLLADIVRRVGGRSFAEFTEVRIFRPLGMNDSYFILPREARARRVIRQDGYPGTRPSRLEPFLPPADSEELDALDAGASSGASTAKDLAIFGQMLLNGGTYGGQRVLSRASVAAMTVPQLAPVARKIWAVPDRNTGAVIEYPSRGGSYGFGLFIVADDRTPAFNGSLMSPRTFGHAGSFASSFWVDPEPELIGVYLSVMPRFRTDAGGFLWHFDHFQDMAHAAVLD